MMNTKIYGIKNCDTMKKAFYWLAEHKVNYIFIDYRVEGITKKKVSEWLKKVKPEELVNTKSTTFKELTDREKDLIKNKETVADLVLLNPTMIKRPLIEIDGDIYLGYKPVDWALKMNLDA